MTVPSGIYRWTNIGQRRACNSFAATVNGSDSLGSVTSIIAGESQLKSNARAPKIFTSSYLVINCVVSAADNDDINYKKFVIFTNTTKACRYIIILNHLVCRIYKQQ